MLRYIALLRGINVGGHRKIKMADLKEMFSAMEFKNVRTYIQSGNVVFDTREYEPGKLAHKIEQRINETFGYDVPVILRTAPEMKEALKGFPFEEPEGWKGYISFLLAEPAEEQQKELASSSTIETFQVRKREVYSLVDKQTKEKPLFSNNFIEKRLDMPATTRNLRTVAKILELAED